MGPDSPTSGCPPPGPAEWIDETVWGTAGDVGFTRDGTHAERIAVPIASLWRKPKRLSFAEAASVGVYFVAAWCGLVEAAALAAGEMLVIIGASDLPAAARTATDGKGASVVFDTVGGIMFRRALACLAQRGRLVEISATGQREASFDLADFYHNESRLVGIDTLKRDIIASAQILDALTPDFESGDYRPAPIAETVTLKEARQGYAKVAAGAIGRIVLTAQL